MEIFNINWKAIVQETLMITSFVIIMMLLIEFVNVLTRGQLTKKLSQNPFIQVVTGTLLGLIPGCMGTFTAVSLYTHGMLSFGALVATMIATSGDEAFLMLAWIPRDALLVFAILGGIALISGLSVDKIFKKKNFAEKKQFKFDIHKQHCGDKAIKLMSIKNFNFKPDRLFLIGIIGIILILSFTGWIGHHHSNKLIFSVPDKNTSELITIDDIQQEYMHSHEHHENCEHNHAEKNNNVDSNYHKHNHGIDWIKLTIIISSIISLFIILFSSDHFVVHHLIDHVLKKHFLKIFLWVAGTLILISLLLHNFDVGLWIYNNMFFILIIAVLLGIIPQSGPHLIFVVLFIQGVIPFSILLASSIVQDGHGSLPLLAESKKSSSKSNGY